MMVWRERFRMLDNRVAVQRNQPADLQLIGGDSLLGQQLARFLDDALGRSPADQGHVGIRRALQRGRLNRGFNAGDFAHPLFHHGAALHGVGVFVADEHAVFIVLVARDHVGVAGNSRERREAKLRSR